MLCLGNEILYANKCRSVHIYISALSREYWLVTEGSYRVLIYDSLFLFHFTRFKKYCLPKWVSLNYLTCKNQKLWQCQATFLGKCRPAVITSNQSSHPLVFANVTMLYFLNPTVRTKTQHIVCAFSLRVDGHDTNVTNSLYIPQEIPAALTGQNRFFLTCEGDSKKKTILGSNEDPGRGCGSMWSVCSCPVSMEPAAAGNGLCSIGMSCK